MRGLFPVTPHLEKGKIGEFGEWRRAEHCTPAQRAHCRQCWEQEQAPARNVSAPEAARHQGQRQREGNTEL